jgi:hypothetical protein
MVSQSVGRSTSQILSSSGCFPVLPQQFPSQLDVSIARVLDNSMDLASSCCISPQTEIATLLPVELQLVTVSLCRWVGVPSERVTCFQWVFLWPDQTCYSLGADTLCGISSANVRPWGLVGAFHAHFGEGVMSFDANQDSFPGGDQMIALQSAKLTSWFYPAWSTSTPISPFKFSVFRPETSHSCQQLHQTGDATRGRLNL